MEAYLIALAYSLAHKGHDHRTLLTPAGKAVELGLVESLSYQTVRLHLRKQVRAPLLCNGAGCGGNSSGVSQS